MRTGKRPEHAAQPPSNLPRCARPTHSDEPPVPTRVSDGSTPSARDAGTPAADAGTAPVVPYQEGMTPMPPQLVDPGEPFIYPEGPLHAGIEGEAILLCVIQTSGHVTNCRVLKAPADLGDALVQMMHTRRYQPMTFQNRIVAVEYAFYVNVKLPEGYEGR
ncbi:TonB family protein [Archangium violaceum]|nr:TonB family protein [Archangium violaceum]